VSGRLPFVESLKQEGAPQFLAYTELRLYVCLAEVGNGKEEEYSFAVVPSARDLGNLEAAEKGPSSLESDTLGARCTLRPMA